MKHEATYVLPLKWHDTDASSEMTSYLEWLSAYLEVIVVDGSGLQVFEHHEGLWSRFAKHIRPDPDLTFANGKVAGVTTGMRSAGNDRTIVADDDIRFDEVDLERVIALLDQNDVVVVQSYFDPAPWHARWDLSRILLNRAIGVHFPAAMGLRRSTFLRAGGYDGDVLFENLELIRTMRFAGGRIAAPSDLFVRHLPPQQAAFFSQRVRQAYDDFTLPARMALWLSLAPLTVGAALRGRQRAILAGAVASMGMAEIGRRRGGGARLYPVGAVLFAPLWLLERALCAWVALWYRLARGGVPYRDGILKSAATPPRKLRSRIRRRLAHLDRGR